MYVYVCICACLSFPCTGALKCRQVHQNRSLIQYVKDIEDKENNAHFILCKNYSGDHPNAPDMSDTVRWVGGGVTRKYSIVLHTHIHMTHEY